MALALSNFRLTLPEWWQDDQSEPPVLTELTAKRWKGLTLLALIMAWSGLAVLGWQMWSGLYMPLIETGLTPTAQPIALLKDAYSGVLAQIGFALIVAALIIGIYARFMAWWRHG
jgi:hypothetical protein